MHRLTAGLHRLFDDMGLGSAGWDSVAGSGVAGPRLVRGPSSPVEAKDPDVTVFRKGDTVVIRADLPGANREHLHVDVRSDTLTIYGDWDWEGRVRSDARDHRASERNHGTFFRSIPLVEGADAEHCEAHFRDGVLEVEFHLPHDPKPEWTSIAIG